MARLPNEGVDLVVTSPPYNLGVRYRKYSDRQDRRSYLNWCANWAAQVRRVLKPSGSFFLNIGSSPSNPMLPHEIVFHLRREDRRRPARARCPLSRQEQHRSLVAHARARRPLSGQYLVHSLRNNSEPRKGATASGHVSGSARRMVHKIARRLACAHDARSVSWYRKLRRC